MALSDIVSQVISDTKDSNGSVRTHDAVERGVPLVKEDDEAVDQCISEALSIRIKNVALNERKKDKTRISGPDDLFGLRGRHALDTDGRMLKATHALTRLEFERIRQIRRDSLRADEAYLAKLDNAAAVVSPVWDANPDLTFGEVCALLRRAA
jgi:hypothetical protein